MAVKISNQEFWNLTDVIQSQDRATPELMYYEKYLLSQVPATRVRHVLVLGCGTGREIPGILSYYPQAHITAVDLSENMIKVCLENLKAWGISPLQVNCVVSSAEELQMPSQQFDVVVIFNNMITYVTPAASRAQLFRNTFQLLKPEGVLLGVAHHQRGGIRKTIYFLLQQLYGPIAGVEVGSRNGGFFGKSVPTFYYSNRGLRSDLEGASFIDVQVLSLADYAARNGASYNMLKGTNNLLFYGQRPR
jgi:ubiquinone/menaquinone biosynthesis C-methylase UbiE